MLSSPPPLFQLRMSCPAINWTSVLLFVPAGSHGGWSVGPGHSSPSPSLCHRQRWQNPAHMGPLTQSLHAGCAQTQERWVRAPTLTYEHIFFICYQKSAGLEVHWYQGFNKHLVPRRRPLLLLLPRWQSLGGGPQRRKFPHRERRHPGGPGVLPSPQRPHIWYQILSRSATSTLHFLTSTKPSPETQIGLCATVPFKASEFM